MDVDAEGKTLADYPRPSVAVDTALLTVEHDELVVLEARRNDGTGWALPGRIVREHERLAAAVERSLLEKAGVEGLRPRQLRVFDEPDRDPRGWVMSVAHSAVVPLDQLATRFRDRTRLMPVANPGRLPFQHDEIIALAVAELRSRYLASPDPGGLLGEEFTMRDLRRVHEAVLGAKLEPDTFRRRMLKTCKLAQTRRGTEGTRGRPAELFRRSRPR
jgi:8-oxo-dGTP diphosphatase